MIFKPSTCPDNETPERHATFEALRQIIPDLLYTDVMPSGVNLVELERQAIDLEVEACAYAKASGNGTPTGHAWAKARNELRPSITERFKTLGAVGYLREKLQLAAA